MKTKSLFKICVSVGILPGLFLPVLNAENAPSGSKGKHAAPKTNDARLIGEVSDGRPVPPASKKPMPKYEIEQTQTHHKNGQKFVINRVKKPAQQVTPSQAPVARRSITPQTKRESKPQGGFFMVSATVYDHRVTLLRWSHDGEEFSAWSNVDWNHLGGVVSFEGRGKEYAMTLLSSNVSLRKLKQQRRKGEKVSIPEIPKLPRLAKRGARYMIIKGDEANDGAMGFIEAVHDLYDAEKVRLVRAYHERERNRIIRERKEAASRNNPPPKKDAIINYWRKNKPSGKKAK